MTPAAIPATEAVRLQSLRHLEILDTAPEAEFNALVRAASMVCCVPISLISLVDTDRQWFKANHGLDGATGTPREMAFCAHAILDRGIFEVPDAALDRRFHDNPLVTDAPYIRFYAGMPLTLKDGERVGTVCVIDKVPRVLDPTQRAILRELGTAAVHALESRRAVLAERQSVEAKAHAAAVVANIFALSPDGFAALDANGILTFCSPRFGQLARADISHFTGRPLKVLLAHLASLTNGACAVPASLVDEPWSLMVEAVERTGLQLLEMSLHSGGTESMTGLLRLRDVSKQHELNRMKSEFLAVAAHELRTPMTSVFGYAELLLEREIAPDRQRSILEKMHRQCKSLMEVTTGLLDLAHLESRGGGDFDRQSLDLLEIVQSATEDFETPAGRVAPNLRVHGTTPALVLGDRIKLQQVFVNLLSNAYKYSPGGGDVEIRLLTDAHRVRLEVEDQGIGMSPGHLSHVSEKFFRADQSGLIPGTGLGMSIVKEIVTLHGGSIEITSEVGVGTKVAVVLATDRSDADLAAVQTALFGSSGHEGSA